jgi:alkyldihydroxyacetonephosphate synthase
MSMIRVNGWGDESRTADVKHNALEMLKSLVGEPRPWESRPVSDLLEGVTEPRAPELPGIITDRLQRFTHSHGQSLPDWVAMRFGHLPRVVDGVVFPESTSDVQELLQLASRRNIVLIPYGGGTSVVGHLTVTEEERPVLSVSMEKMRSMLSLDSESRLATFQTGVLGPDIENALNPRGFTLGHFPQSFEYSSLGGWIATRSSGQQSRHFGRIDELFQGGEVVTPTGPMSLPSFPASAAGPDLRELFLGSEGRLGFLTEATVRVSETPERDDFFAVFFPSWLQGLRFVRQLAVSALPISMIRLSNPLETEINLVLAGHETVMGGLVRYLGLRGIEEKSACMCIIGLIGNKNKVKEARSELKSLLRGGKAVWIGRVFGNAWKKNRFKAPYLRNSLWDLGYAVDTVETAVNWNRVDTTMLAMEQAISSSMSNMDEKALVFSHLSHVYPTGSSIYTTYLFRVGDSPEKTLALWREAKGAVSRAIVAGGGTISHQHGVGTDHADFLTAEKGQLGLELLLAVSRQLDPQNILNPGKLLPVKIR